MTPGRLSPRSEITPVPSHGSIFVCMIPPQNVMPARVTPAWVHPGSRTRARISLRYEISQRYHVNAKRPPILVWNRSAGRLERVAHEQCLRFWSKRVFYQPEMYRYEDMFDHQTYRHIILRSSNRWTFIYSLVWNVPLNNKIWNDPVIR